MLLLHVADEGVKTVARWILKRVMKPPLPTNCFSFDQYLNAVSTNSSAPIPIAIGQADSCLNSFSSITPEMDKVAAFKMMMLAWSSLRAATIMANSGMALQAPAVQRQALESIAYGYLFVTDPDFHKHWKDRHESADAEKTFRYKGWRRTLKVIRLSNANLGDRIIKQYDHLINVGAHPNVLAIDQMSTYKIEEGADTGSVEFTMLFGQPFVSYSHILTFETYMILVDAVIDIWPERSVDAGLTIQKERAQRSSLEFIRNTRNLFDQVR